MSISNPENFNMQYRKYGKGFPKPDYEDSKRDPQHLSNLLSIFFNWLFFLGIAPFRLSRENENLFKIRRNYLQIAVSAILNIISVLCSFSSIRMGFSADQFKDFTNPRNFFYFASFSLAFTFQVWFEFRIWFHQESFLNIVNNMQSDHFLLRDKILCLKTKYVIQILNLWLYGIVLYEPILKSFPPSVLSFEGNLWNSQTILYGRFTFFVSSSLQESVKNTQASNLDYFLAGLYVLGFIHGSAIGISQYLILFYSVLTVRMASSSFASELQMDMSKRKLVLTTTHDFYEPGKYLTWSLVSRKYDAIRVLCQYTNEACGSLFAIFLATNLVTQAVGMDTVFVIPDLLMKIRYIFVISLSVFIPVLAADVCNQLSILKIWLAKDCNRRNVSNDQLDVVIMQLNNRQVGIRSFDKFTVTYSLLWNILSTSITYFTICIQVRQ